MAMVQFCSGITCYEIYIYKFIATDPLRTSSVFHDHDQNFMRQMPTPSGKVNKDYLYHAI